MPSPQKKSATNSPKRYLIFEPNHILVTLIWDDRRSLVTQCLSVFFLKGTYAGSFLNKYK